MNELYIQNVNNEFTSTRKVFLGKLNKLKNQELWEQYVKINTDPYSKCCVDVARRVMELLDDEERSLVNDNTLQEKGIILPTSFNLISQAEKDIDSGGITGAMAGFVIQMVKVCHKRGEEFALSSKNQL